MDVDFEYDLKMWVVGGGIEFDCIICYLFCVRKGVELFFFKWGLVDGYNNIGNNINDK
jgi:hypothetical protein